MVREERYRHTVPKILSRTLELSTSKWECAKYQIQLKGTILFALYFWQFLSLIVLIIILLNLIWMKFICLFVWWRHDYGWSNSNRVLQLEAKTPHPWFACDWLWLSTSFPTNVDAWNQYWSCFQCHLSWVDANSFANNIFRW